MRRPFVFLFGYVKYSLPASEAHLAAELCRLKKRVYRRFDFCGDTVYVEIPLLSSTAFERDCKEAGIPIALHSRHGLMHVRFWKIPMPPLCPEILELFTAAQNRAEVHGIIRVCPRSGLSAITISRS